MFLIGIDLGTTGARAIIYDSSMRPQGESYTEYSLYTSDGSFAEQNALDWWQLTATSVRNALRRGDTDVNTIQGIAVSSQGISLVPVDALFRPLRYAISWLDTRAEAQTQYILNSFNEEQLFQITGKYNSSLYTLPKIMWLQENEQKMMKRCSYLLLPHDFLVAKMTGKAVTDRTLASGTMMYDINREEWSSEILKAFSVPIQKLPCLVWGGTDRSSNRRSGRSNGASGGDTRLCRRTGSKMCCSGSGIGTGVIPVSVGTSAVVSMINKNLPKLSKFSFFQPNVKFSEGAVNTAGMALRWMKKNICSHLNYQEMDVLAAKARPKSDVICIPRLATEKNICPQASFYNLTLNSSLGDFIVSILEGVAFEIKHYLDIMIAENQGNTQQRPLLRIFGGGAHSDLWCQIFADVSSCTVESVLEPEMACLGLHYWQALVVECLNVPIYLCL